ncbi:MAG TPA: FHA domain-containing protein, partial [Verrucomicrobiae bacterium]|nr:FHA domain-containing protein [Verrucomicrobiae bacterium]
MIYLKHVEGSKKGQVESFDSERIRIGRHPDNDLTFDPEAAREVSGHHAEIVCHKDAVTIKDLQSRNGTYVNGRRINQPTRLTDGDVIQFSSRGPKLVFSIGEPVAGSGTVALKHEEIAAPETTAKKAAGIGTRERIALGAAATVILVVLGLAFWWSWPLFFITLGIMVVVISGGLLAWWWKKRQAR